MTDEINTVKLQQKIEKLKKSFQEEKKETKSNLNKKISRGNIGQLDSKSFRLGDPTENNASRVKRFTE